MTRTLAIKQTRKAALQEIRSLAEYKARFIASLDVCEKSRDTYGRAFDNFVRWAAGRDLNSFTRDTVLEYKKALIEKTPKLSPYTVSLYLVAVRLFYEWTEAERIFPNIARGIKGTKASGEKNKSVLTRQQAGEISGRLKATAHRPSATLPLSSCYCSAACGPLRSSARTSATCARTTA